MEKADRNKLNQQIIALALEGRTLAEIAFKFDLTCAYVLNVILKNNIRANFDYTRKVRPSNYGKLPDKRKKTKIKKTSKLISNKRVVRKKYTDEYLLNHLRDLNIKLGRTPRVHDIIDAGIVTTSTYRIHFGSLYKAKQLAGVYPNKRRNQFKYSHKFLINHLKELSEKLGRTPTEKEIIGAGKYSTSAYKKYFGSISKAQQAAGLIPNKKRNQQRYSKEYLLNRLKELSEQLGKTPSTRDIIKIGKISPSTFIHYFGSTVNAQQVAGLVPNKGNYDRKYTKKYLLNHLKELSEKLGRTPSGKDIVDAGKLAVSTYRTHFGSLDKAQRAAGLFPNKGICRQKYSNEYLLNFLKELSEKLGKTPSGKDIVDAGLCPKIYKRRFGGLAKAQQAAGLVSNKGVNEQKYSNEYLLNYLRELAKHLGRTPSQTDIIEAGKVSTAAFRNHFGSVGKAQQAAGLIPNKHPK